MAALGAALLAQVAPSGGAADQLQPLRLPSVEYSAMVPHLILLGSALALLLAVSLVRPRPRKGLYAWFTVAAGAASGVAAWMKWREVVVHGSYRAVANALVVDGFACFMMIVIAVAVVLGALLADSYLRREGLDGPEFYVLVLLSAAGGMFMATANDLIVLFLGLEILSIALYVLTGYHRRRAESREAAMKYFILGAFSSALFLYGIALMYGATGSTNLVEIGSFLAQNVVTNDGLLLAGLVLILVGLGFKVAAVPFHAWTPDVYQGAPTPVTGFMAAAAKAAGFAGLLRVLFTTFGSQRLDWQPLVWALAVLTLLVGSTLAVVQSDIKRMLAYSSISHAGYVLIGLQAATDRGIAGSLYYLLAYTFMVLGSFAVVTLVGRRGDDAHDLDNYRGLATRRPALALAFTVLLMAQAGIPFTTGFLAKFYVIGAAVQAHSYALALIGMVAAVIAAFFYLRVIVLMYTPLSDEDAAAAPRIPLPFGTGVVLVVAVAFTLAFGIAPQPMIEFARQASHNLLF
ncbi:MAG: NADH-quinone oxidoreductase subunit [Acidimicrobiaceae bacterium]|jgi:NADH-quinone oxidoreductase subunit N|nr:NADH-quinone oxidoreductase subunit [Acidimicrobiaceae bacterium]